MTTWRLDATRALALSEARLLLRAPTLWVGAAVTTGLGVTSLRTGEVSAAAIRTDTGLAALVLAGFLIVLGHLAASRDRRHGAWEAAAALPVRPVHRAVALLVLVPVAGLVGALCLGLESLALVAAWPAGVSGTGWALTALIVPMIGAAIGVAAGSWLSSTAAGPLTLFTLAAAMAVLPVLGDGAGSLPWRLFPVDMGSSPPVDVDWHLLYLLALLLAAVSTARLRHAPRRPLVVGALILAAALAVVAVRRGR
ncbi:hypothetical protein [Actinoplanes sp. NPDC020271]|uniref:hypothetical protein n=1 Tax=Actinoplanes sp. NPDC020271 TaxID=3363896 RepID=UPI00378F96BC